MSKYKIQTPYSFDFMSNGQKKYCRSEDDLKTASEQFIQNNPEQASDFIDSDYQEEFDLGLKQLSELRSRTDISIFAKIEIAKAIVAGEFAKGLCNNDPVSIISLWFSTPLPQQTIGEQLYNKTF